MPRNLGKEKTDGTSKGETAEKVKVQGLAIVIIIVSS